jgi:hypothetical protein
MRTKRLIHILSQTIIFIPPVSVFNAAKLKLRTILTPDFVTQNFTARNTLYKEVASLSASRTIRKYRNSSVQNKTSD